MKKTGSLILLFCMLLLISFPAFANLKLKPVPPYTDSAKYTYNECFSLIASLEAIGELREGLKEFINLTDKTKDLISEKEIHKGPGNLWEEQYIYLPNCLGSIEGTLRKQDYQIKELEFELAKEKYKRRKITKKELSQKEAAYKKAEKSFQTFWDSFGFAD